MMSGIQGVYDPPAPYGLRVRELPVADSDKPHGVERRWEVRDPGIPMGRDGRVRVVMQGKPARGGPSRLLCSCSTEGADPGDCEHRVAVRRTM